MPTWVKFCGIRDWHEVQMAVDAGADAVGFIFTDSPRRIDPLQYRAIAQRLPDAIEPVGVFVDPAAGDIDAALAVLPHLRVQFAGEESPELVGRYEARAIKVLHVGAGDGAIELERNAQRYPQATLLFDTKDADRAGGTGRAFAWQCVTEIARGRPAIVAGGLKPENVGSCIRTIRPYGVDVRSGIETGNEKDARKMRAFVRAVRDADEA